MADTPKKIVLDSNILLRDPGVIARGSSEFEIVVPVSVILDLERQGKKLGADEIVLLIREAKARGLIAFDEAKFGPPESPRELELGTADWMTLLLLRALKDGPDQFVFATDDVSFRRVLEQEGIAVINMAGLQSYLQEPRSAPQKELANKASSIWLYRTLWFGAWAILIGIFAICVGIVIINVAPLLTSLGWGSVGIALAGGYLLYLLRTHRRTWYGAVEIIVGVGTSIYLAYTETEILDPDRLFKLAAALYVIVRGLDNIERGLEETQSRYYPTWTWIWRKAPKT
jgi:rRNA-processing protein FCF1